MRIFHKSGWKTAMSSLIHDVRDESDVTACDAFILFNMKIIVKCLVFYQLCM